MTETVIFGPEEEYECPVCEAVVKESDPKCPQCGTVFEEEEEELESPSNPVATRIAPPSLQPHEITQSVIYDAIMATRSDLEEIQERLDGIVSAQETIEQDITDIKNRAAIGKARPGGTSTVFADDLERGEDEEPPEVKSVVDPPEEEDHGKDTSQMIKELSLLKGIGGSRAERLVELGLESIHDVAEVRLTNAVKKAFGGELRAKEAQKHAKRILKERGQA
jgi:hypothetical protein